MSLPVVVFWSKSLFLGTRRIAGGWLFGVNFLPLCRPVICDRYNAAVFCSSHHPLVKLHYWRTRGALSLQSDISNCYQMRLPVTSSNKAETLASGKTIQGGNWFHCFGYKTKHCLTSEIPYNISLVLQYLIFEENDALKIMLSVTLWRNYAAKTILGTLFSATEDPVGQNVNVIDTFRSIGPSI